MLSNYDELYVIYDYLLVNLTRIETLLTILIRFQLNIYFTLTIFSLFRVSSSPTKDLAAMLKIQTPVQGRHFGPAKFVRNRLFESST